MTGFLFDTCVVSHWYGKKPAVVSRVAKLPGGSSLYISSITIGEIECGHASKFATDKSKQAAFRKWIIKTFSVPELPITRADAETYGRFRAHLFDNHPWTGKKRRPERCHDATGDSLGIDENDLWLVAQAATHNLTFVTTDDSRLLTVFGSEVSALLWPVEEPP